MIEIRQALPSDAAAIAPLMFAAMEEILYHFLDRRDKHEAIAFLQRHIGLSGNQYSFEHIIVAEQDGVVIGELCLYPGEDLQELRAPIIAYLQMNYKRTIPLEAETQAGEVYIDSLAVDEATRGLGIGKLLLLYAMDRISVRQKRTLGLLVEESNPGAKRLYESLGFAVMQRKSLFGKEMEHLQYRVR